MGGPINLAARLESVSKAFPEYTAFITESHLAKLPEDRMMQYKALEPVELKGVEEVEMIYGLPRYEEVA